MFARPLCAHTIDAEFLLNVSKAVESHRGIDPIISAHQQRKDLLEKRAKMTRNPEVKLVCPLHTHWDFCDFVDSMRERTAKWESPQRLSLALDLMLAALEAKPSPPITGAIDSFLVTLEKQEPNASIQKALAICRDNIKLTRMDLTALSI